jgi:PAS domain-containing protein
LAKRIDGPQESAADEPDHPAIEYSTLSGADQEKILHLQQDILMSVARGADHMETINQICRLEEQLLPNSVGSVMLMDDQYEFLNVYAAPSIPPEGVAQLNGLRPGPGGGSCGNVIYREEPQFVSNTFNDPRWDDLRQLAHNFNLCSCWSVPIYSAGRRKIIGTFALSSFEHRSPSPFHRKLLEIGSSIIGIVLERKNAEQAVRIAATVFESQNGTIITDAAANILRVNRAFTEMTGYTNDEVVGKNPRILSSGRHDARFYAAMWQRLHET